METLKIGDRIFKLCDDVPLAVKEKRKLFWISNVSAFELRCVSENMGPRKAFMFLYDLGGSLGESYFYQYREKDCQFNYKLYFDVTPEKRYAIWNKLTHRFVAHRHWFSTRVDAEAYIHGCASTWRSDALDILKIVEFDNPDQE